MGEATGEASRRLYHRLALAAARARQRYDAAALARAEITTAQAAALFCLEDGLEDGLEDAAGRSQRELARMLRVREPSITQMLQRLEERGLVERRPDPTDARARLVVLSAAGRRALRRLRPALEELNAELVEGFTRRELTIVERFLDHVARR